MPASASPVFFASSESRFVKPDTGVGVEHHERRGLSAQVFQQQDQHGVLENLRRVTGVIGVPIVHRFAAAPERVFVNVR
jgi:hypothetical protein